MNTIEVDIVSAEGELHKGQATLLIASAIEGEIGIAANHTPLLTKLKAGEVRVQTADGEEETFFVSGGIMEVQPKLVTILADTGIRAADIDEAAALQAKQRAEEALANNTSEMEVGAAQAELAIAMAQLQSLSKLRKKVKH